MKIKFIALISLTFAILINGCGIAHPTASNAKFLDIYDVKTRNGDTFKVHHALQEQDIESWNTTEKALVDFTDYWTARGISLKDVKLSVAIQPLPTLPKSEILQQMYGSELPTALTLFKERINIATSNSELENISREAFCSFPPLLFKSVYIQANNELNKTRLKMLNAIDAFANPATSEIAGFKFNNASAAFVPEIKCGALLLGRSDDLTKRYNAFGTPNVVQHEMGHVFHSVMWNIDEPIIPNNKLSGSLNEVVADIFAHSYSGDPCHNKLPNPDGNTGEYCTRIMDKHSKSLRSAMVTEYYNIHENGQALRHLLWNIRSEIGQEAFAKNFVTQIYSIKNILLSSAATQIDTPDYFLRNVQDINRQLIPTEAFARNICSVIPNNTCAILDEYLGTDISLKLNNLIANAPSRNLNIWQNVNIEGKNITFRFVLDMEKKNINLEVGNSDNTTTIFTENGMSFENETEYLSFSYNENDKTTHYASWSENGVLSFKTTTSL